MDILPYGREALVVNFEQRIDPAINARVHALNEALSRAALPGVRFAIPAFCSLTIGFDPRQLSFSDLAASLHNWADQLEATHTTASRTWRVPVCFSEEFAWDKTEVLSYTGVANWQTLVDQLTAIPLRVYMLGFLPGFPYLGALPPSLACPRKAKPRARVAVQSVSIAGQQAGIYPSTSPGGWQIVGRTPLPLFLGKMEQPFLFAAGDEVRFFAVKRAVYEDIASRFVRKNISWNDFLVSGSKHH
ncbi:MAG: 5-oxoprolinase subunit PxpB [Bacteroidetes bacterium]|nr:MAG: 5-oxoprolinase subunit PxpB [Bacteroidota bacterium]